MQVFVDKYKSFTKTYKKYAEIDQIDIQSRYSSIQQITKYTTGSAYLSFQIVCLDYNNSLVEMYTFGHDAYRQVIEQLIPIKDRW